MLVHYLQNKDRTEHNNIYIYIYWNSLFALQQVHCCCCCCCSSLAVRVRHHATTLLHFITPLCIFYRLYCVLRNYSNNEDVLFNRPAFPPTPPPTQTNTRTKYFVRSQKKKKMKLLFERRAAIEVETEAGTRGGGGGGGGRGGMRSIKKIIIIIKNDRTHRVRFSLF